MENAVQFAGADYWMLLGLLALGRAADFLSTRIATPNLVLEGNPFARKLGWRWGLLVNLALIGWLARWPMPAIAITTTSLLVAARNFQNAWLMRTMGEDAYRAWSSARFHETPLSLFLACLFAQALLYSAVGAALIAWSGDLLVPFAIGVGTMAYAGAVVFYTLISLWRLRRSLR